MTKAKNHRSYTKANAASRKARGTGTVKHNCPTPYKLAYVSRAAADAALMRSWRAARSGKGTRRPIRFYKCPCGRWHLTSTPHRAQ